MPPIRLAQISNIYDDLATVCYSKRDLSIGPIPIGWLLNDKMCPYNDFSKRDSINKLAESEMHFQYLRDNQQLDNNWTNLLQKTNLSIAKARQDDDPEELMIALGESLHISMPTQTGQNYLKKESGEEMQHGLMFRMR